MTAAVFAEVWARAVREHAADPFLVFEAPDGSTAAWTYAEFEDCVQRVGATLHDRGVGPGDAVHLALANSPTFVASWLATTQLGAWIVPSDPMARTPELHEHIQRTKPRVGLCAAARADEYMPAAGDMPTIEVDEADTTFRPFVAGTSVTWMRPQAPDRAAVMFTSGTTGRPKGVEITQANYAFAGEIMAGAAGVQAHHRQIVVLPLFHANAQYYSFASAIWAGASIALMHGFSARSFTAQATRHEATHASLFGAPLRMMLAAHARITIPEAHLAHCWFAQNIAEAQYAQVVALLGCRPRQLYGMTETIPAVLTDGAENTVPASMGFVTAGCQVDVWDETGRSVEAGEVGEVVVGGEPGVTLFAAYLDDPSTTVSSFRDGWFRTGDRARRDADGRHYFDGRRSDVLKVAGENVSIVEVERVLADHPAVLEAAVVGKPDDVRDEVPVGFVVAADAADPPRVEELHEWCARRLGKAKRPREITLVDELPRTSVGKIRKFLLVNPDAEGASAKRDPADRHPVNGAAIHPES